MSTATNLAFDELHVPALVALPRELAVVLDEDGAARAAFDGLDEGDRRSFAEYVADARIPQIRERRAALVAMRLRVLVRG